MKILELQGSLMPALGFGTWQLTGAQCVASVAAAIRTGYRHIDTAQIYDNEAEVGQAIAESGVKRMEFFVTTKLWTTNFGKKQAAASLDESLKKLRMDYVDLLLMHWPNPEVPLQETLEAMQALQRAGKTKTIGVSNFPVKLMQEALETCKAPIACNQVEYHVALSQRAVLDYARKHGIVVTAYSPLGRGKLAQRPELVRIGEKYGKTGGQVALRWLIEQDGVAAIPKAASEKNMRSNFEIFDFALDEEDQKILASLGGSERLVSPSFAPKWDAA